MIGPTTAKASRIGSRSSSTVSRRAYAHSRARSNAVAARIGLRFARHRSRRRRFDLLRPVDAGGVGEIADECVFERIAAALLDQIHWRADRQHLAGMHQRDAVAALRLVHEMGREKDRDAVVAGEIDHRAPERVAGDRIDARSRLVENENGGLVQHRHGKLQPLLNAEWETFGLGVGDLFQIVAL